MGARRQRELGSSEGTRFDITREVNVLFSVILRCHCSEFAAVLFGQGRVPKSGVARGEQVVGSRRGLASHNRLLQMCDGLLVLSHLGEDPS